MVKVKLFFVLAALGFSVGKIKWAWPFGGLFSLNITVRGIVMTGFINTKLHSRTELPPCTNVSVKH